MVIVEDHDGADHTAGYHDHDAGEVGSYQRSLTARWLHAGDHVPKLFVHQFIKYTAALINLTRNYKLEMQKYNRPNLINVLLCIYLHEHCQGHQHRDLKGHLLPGVGREVEPEHSHTEMIISFRKGKKVTS